MRPGPGVIETRIWPFILTSTKLRTTYFSKLSRKMLPERKTFGSIYL